MNCDNAIMLAKSVGFTHAAVLDVASIRLQEEVRDMCASGNCGQYGKNWSCPPHQGSIDECRRQIQSYHNGILVQTVGNTEDCFDIESMLETEALHKELVFALQGLLLLHHPRLLTLGAGCCTLCKSCTCPSEPCRMPEKRISSMEAYGMLVLEVCRDNQLAYNYGPNKIAYTSCFLLD